MLEVSGVFFGSGRVFVLFFFNLIFSFFFFLYCNYLLNDCTGGGFVMDQRSFEQKWLRLPQLSSRNDTFLPPMPGIGDIKLHMMERNFNIVASGTIEGVTRIYMHCLVSSENYLLVEVVISAGVDASAQCTLTTTIKIDASGMGDPNLSRIVDSMELSLLFRI